MDTPQMVDGVAIKMQAKQYIPTSPRSFTDGFTLLLAHGSAHHKEIWEPIIDQLFQYQMQETGPLPIREVWSLDWPSHGQSAMVNSPVLWGSHVVVCE
ncbi:hypothetical protein EIP86_006008 [Pleurotus ostreatoroseus]|nr:hypothetical protein EIP86_006008 [Pleurotus ostreatoroseus]